MDFLNFSTCVDTCTCTVLANFFPSCFTVTVTVTAVYAEIKSLHQKVFIGYSSSHLGSVGINGLKIYFQPHMIQP